MRQTGDDHDKCHLIHPAIISNKRNLAQTKRLQQNHFTHSLDHWQGAHSSQLNSTTRFSGDNQLAALLQAGGGEGGSGAGT